MQVILIRRIHGAFGSVRGSRSADIVERTPVKSHRMNPFCKPMPFIPTRRLVGYAFENHNTRKDTASYTPSSMTG